MKNAVLTFSFWIATCVRYFFYVLLLAYSFFVMTGLQKNSPFIQSLEYTYQTSMNKINIWILIPSLLLIGLILFIISQIARLTQKLIKELKKEDYFNSNCQTLLGKIFLNLVLLTTSQATLTFLLYISKAVGPHNFLNLRWSDFLLNAIFLFLTYMVWQILKKGEAIQLENSEII